jgi:hypothetical protein
MIKAGLAFLHEMAHGLAYLRAGCARVGFARDSQEWVTVGDGWWRAQQRADDLAISVAGDAAMWLARRMLSNRHEPSNGDKTSSPELLARAWLADPDTQALLDLGRSNNATARGAGVDFEAVRRHLCRDPCLRARLLPIVQRAHRDAEIMVRAGVHELMIPLDEIEPEGLWVLNRAELDALTRGWPVAGRVEPRQGFTSTPDVRAIVRAVGSGIEARHVVAAPAAGAACAERVDQVQVAPPRRDSAQPAPMMGFRRGATVGARHLTLGVAAASARAAGRRS